MSITIDKVSKHFVGFRALHEVSLEIPTGGLVALLGPSGCGKTTLLRMVAGLDQPDSGRVLIDGDDMTRVAARERRVGFVFQHYALFKHMTVYDNIAFGLSVLPRSRRPTKHEINTKVCALLELVQLDGLAQRYPNQLSGGQRQRVALARALAINPKVLLLDEPFGALDTKVRKELRRWLRALHDELHVTSIFVTHDQEEALDVADNVVVMNNGHIEQTGTPSDVYERPKTPFVYQFLGETNTFHAVLRHDTPQVPDFDFSPEAPAGQVTTVFARPHELTMSRTAVRGSAIAARLTDQRRVGSSVRLVLEPLDGTGMINAEFAYEQFASEGWQVGELVWIRPSNPQVFTSSLH